ncbi:hypothetical protein NQ314_013496 [Rhamnusium bicolor]|uniref:Uncharacterized protein n=1 Tax=Rhamnusium bicolor TaxID=1586634 RepID=A0AAV8X6R2_9CUCU|nr:hypothetical protein NQ314_013496 [Rhamnusium bicolor]
MKNSATILLLTVLTITYADELSDCKCWDGYEAKKSQDGVHCSGILVFHAQPCNIPERPKCVCSGNVNGILSDAEGTWCAEYSEGKGQRKWACENKEDWDKFFKQYPNEKP